MKRALVLLFLSLPLFADPTRAVVPRVKTAPKIDGRVTPTEWKGSTNLALSENEGEIRLLHDDNYLYVGIVAMKTGLASVCVPGKTGVRVLHASAALGTAAFEQEEGKWKLTRGFLWTNRDTGDSAEAMADREKFIKTSGWFANTHPGVMMTRELQIPIRRDQKELPIVIGFHIFNNDEAKYTYWPANIEDGCADAELAAGNTAHELTFDPSTWGVIELQP